MKPERESLQKAGGIFAPKARIYPLRAEHQHAYPIVRMCQVLWVSLRGYEAWGKRLPSPDNREAAERAEHVKPGCQANRRVDGSPWVHAQVRTQGITCARQRVGRPRHRTITTHSQPEA